MPPPLPVPPPKPLPPPVVTPPAPPPPVVVAPPVVEDKKVSHARTALDYRKDAASHLYALNQHRIYAGKMPPQLKAVGVLQLDINNQGQITSLHWTRAPSHVPAVMAEIERTVRQAAPFPAPVRMGKVSYTEVWLWDTSGRFQLDTLTEGQL